MSSLRIVNVAPIVRDHYGTLWYDSQHPLGYLLVLIGLPFVVSLIGIVIQIDSTLAKWAAGLFGVILGLSGRTAFGLPSIGDGDGEREKRAVTQLRRGAMYSVLVGVISFIVSLVVTGGFYIANNRPELVDSIENATTPVLIAWLPNVATIALLFLLFHYLVTMLVLARWLHLMSETGTL